MQRRDVLKWATAAAAMGMTTPHLWAGDKDNASLNWDRVLVLIELKGGNDGLNTLVPYNDKNYYRYRKNLFIAQDRVLRLTPQLGLHPNLEPLMPAWKEKDLAIIQGCGYAKPNRSHFRGIDIWHGGTDADKIAHDGWLARLLHGALAHDKPAGLLADSIVWGHDNTVGHGGLGPLYGRELRTLVMNSPRDFLKRAAQITPSQLPSASPAHAHILKTQNDIVASATTLKTLLADAQVPAGTFPTHRFGQHMQHTAKLIGAGAKLPVYKLTLDGFDTHAGQQNRHENLLATLGQSLGAFRNACIQAGVWDKVLVMTYSEFGRRAYDNDSYGTDHGTAAPHFYMGGQVKGGLYGKTPSLKRLDGGDLIHTTDYRSLYTTVAERWWGYDGEFLDKQRRYKSLSIFKKS